ncbi:MAG: type II toxin-antitoxin system VapC family toxin [Bacteroidia bacterium]|nr:type II toxin-antitoxin system VapC family toxin [Bacteroidia bacterium]
MKIFLDTCALFKLYHSEDGSEEIENIFIKNKVSALFLSEITKIEFTSTVWKKVRMVEITEKQAKELIQLFENDKSKFTWIQIDNKVISQTTELIAKYGKQGLRTLDSLQLATAVILKNQVLISKTTDKLLNQFFESEGLLTQ